MRVLRDAHNNGVGILGTGLNNRGLFGRGNVCGSQIEHIVGARFELIGWLSGSNLVSTTACGQTHGFKQRQYAGFTVGPVTKVCEANVSDEATHALNDTVVMPFFY